MKVFQSQPRMLGRTWMSLAALLLPMSTNALQFTNHCEREIRPEDRELFEVAADLMDRYRHAVEDHINRTIISGNLDNYTVIDEATMDDWRGAVDDMLDGTIKLACEYDTTDRCANDDDLFGWENEVFPGSIHVCIENVRDFTSQQSGSPLALLAGTLSHELMHTVDGFLTGHGGDGSSVTNPSTDAETIGVAMEHLILTPDLDATIRGVEIDCCDHNDDAVVTFDVLVRNLNAEADTQVRPLSGATRNTQSVLRVEVDGQTERRSIDALDGSASEVQSFVFHLPPHEVAGDGIHDIVAIADIDDLFFESNERNNTDEATVSTSVDLSLGIEVTAPPRCHIQEYRADATPAGYYDWIAIPYRAEVVNLDPANTSPRVDIVMTYEDMWSNGSTPGQVAVWSDSLPPYERDHVYFTLEIPTDPDCSGPLAGTQVWFEADGNDETINDVDRGNNTVYLLVDADYWRPDYVIRDVSSAAADLDARTLNFAVRNIGPTGNFTNGPSPLASTQVTDASGVTTHFSAFTRSLEPGAEQRYEAIVPVDDCDTATYWIEADRLDVIAEYNESNNVTEVRLAPVVSGGVCTSFENGGDQYEPGLEWIEQNGTDVLYDKFDVLNTEEWGSDRATGEEIDSRPPILDQQYP